LKQGQWVSIVIILTVSLLLTFGCAGPGGSDASSADTKTSAVLKVTLPSKARPQLASALGTVADVDRVTVEVVETANSSNIIQSETALTETSPGAGDWSLTLGGLPVDKSLDFIGKAYNANDVVIFEGTVTQTLTAGGGNSVALRLTSVDDGIDPAKPKIVSVTIAEEIGVNSSANPITFTIEHTGPVAYEVSVDGGEITSNKIGSYDPSSGSPLTVDYNAPATPDTYYIKLKVNVPGASGHVGAVYPISVVEIVQSAQLTVLFGPAIIGMDFLRTSNSLEVTAVTDPTTDLNYAWVGTDDFENAFTDPAANPAIIPAYTDTDSGTIAVTVTDANSHSASLSWTVGADDFPYTINRPQTGENLTGNWNPINTDGLIQPTTNEAHEPHMISYDSKLHLTWPEYKDGGGWSIRAANWDGVSTWSFLGDQGQNGMNADLNLNASSPQLIEYMGLYAVWIENPEGIGQVRGAKWIDPNWVPMNGGNTFNKDSGKSARDAKTVVFNDNLYITWSEEASEDSRQIRVARYDNTSGTLSFIDGDGATGINHDPSKQAELPFLTVFNSTLVAAWHEKGGPGVANENGGTDYIEQIRMAKWLGDNSWQFIDGDGATGINKNPDYPGMMPELIVYDSGLYITWAEKNDAGVEQIRVAKHDPANGIVFIDGGGANGLNKDTTKFAGLGRFAVFNSKLYLSWMENTTNDMENDGYLFQVRVAEWNGTSWRFVDGDGVNGLNIDPTQSGERQQLLVHNGKLDIVWAEDDAVAGYYRLRLAEAVTK
jgi:hypothetical protein